MEYNQGEGLMGHTTKGSERGNKKEGVYDRGGRRDERDPDGK